MVNSNPQILQVSQLLGPQISSLTFLLFLNISSLLLLQPMLLELGKQNPQLLRLIQENQAEFIQLLNEPYEGSDG